MTERERVIRERGQANFDRKNDDPTETFDVELVKIGAPYSKKSAKRPIEESRRREFLKRAEQELINEGALDGPAVFGD